MNLGVRLMTPVHLWNDEAELLKLSDLMKKDRSARLAMIILTNDGMYNLKQFDTEKFSLQVRIVPKE